LEHLHLLKDQLIIITGGSSGIGLATANALIKGGATVIATSRKIEFSKAPIIPNSLNYQYLDVNIVSSINDFFLWLREHNHSLSVLINNAGIGIFKPFIEIKLEEWNSIVTTNLSGSFLCSQQAIPLMEKNGGGRIINIGSVVELAGIENNSAYAASKGGLKALSLVISSEFQKKNITATHISLGAVYSDIWKERNGFCQKDMLAIDRVADTIKYIASLPHEIRIDHIELTPLKKIL
jgi:3-oxoacyl-[acyl-carrier protein] reductase